MLEIGVLGPVRAVRDGQEVGLGGPKPRAVLALLLGEAGRVVPAEYLEEALWRGAPPPGSAKTLRSYVSRLRSLLSPEAALVARGGGYSLMVPPDRVDASRFEGLVGAGCDALGGGEAAAAADRFGQALTLWRGRALADVAEVEPLALEAARLEELRLVAVEGRAEADIELGRHAEVIGELERLVAEYPVRERLWRLLVLALYRAERQADALAAYRRARAVLAEELGIEPGEELRQLEEAVLRQEVSRPALRRMGHNLPVPLTGLLGREQQLAALRGLLGNTRLVTLTGAGGAGKTRLAVEVANGVLKGFPDGAWLVGLAGITDPDLVPSLVMEALGVRQSRDAQVIEALRYRLRSAELLLVLDNCEHLLGACAELAGALLEGSPGLRVLATSREPLGIPGEVVFPVPPLVVPPEPASEEALAGAAAVRLFLERAAATQAGSGIPAPPVAAVARICRDLDGLPLAIELAAARTSTLSVEEIETRLADKFAFLAYRRPVANPRHQALKAAIDWSYGLLSAREARVLRELSVFAGDFGLAQVADVCCGGDEAAALAVIDELASKSLVVARSAAGTTRYRLLETIRQYAAGCLAETGQAGQARHRHALAYLGVAERERDLAALSRDHENFRAALTFSLSGGDRGDIETGPRLASALGDFWLARGFLQEGRDWLERALACPGQHQRSGLLRLLGNVLYQIGDLRQAQATLVQATQAAVAAGLPSAQARIGVLLVEIHNNIQGGTSNREALTECEAAAAVLASEGDMAGLAEAWLAIGQMRFFLGDASGSGRAFERAAAYASQSGNHSALKEARGWLVLSFWELPIQADVAIGRAEQLLETASGDPWAEASVLQPLSLLYAMAGRFADARAGMARCQAIFTRSGAELERAVSAMPAGDIEMIAGDAAAAERKLMEGCQALRAMGERAYLAGVLARLAETVYEQGRFGEAQSLADEARAAAPNDLETGVMWRATSAKLLARRGQFTAAQQLAGEAVTKVSATSYMWLLAQALVASAEVCRRAGAPAEAETSLRQALRIYEDRRVPPLAERARAALTSLGVLSSSGPA